MNEKRPDFGCVSRRIEFAGITAALVPACPVQSSSLTPSAATGELTARHFRHEVSLIVDQFEEMLEQSARQPLVFALSLHGFIVGQPFRLRPLRQAIKHCLEKGKDRIWITRAGDIAKHCYAMAPGIIPGS